MYKEKWQITSTCVFLWKKISKNWKESFPVAPMLHKTRANFWRRVLKERFKHSHGGFNCSADCRRVGVRERRVKKMETCGCALACVSAICFTTKAVCVCARACVLAEGQAAVQLLCLSLVKQVALNPQSVFQSQVWESVRKPEDRSHEAVFFSLFFPLRIPGVLTH